jgi:uncharacterized membrane protein YkvA (DUF1232 family)
MLPTLLLIAAAVGSAASGIWLLRRASTVERTSSRMLASIVLAQRLLTDRRVGRLPKTLLLLPVAYYVSPIQLIPNFIPVLGQLDDVVVLGICLRLATRRLPRGLLAELWPGPELSSADQGSLRPRAASSDA